MPSAAPTSSRCQWRLPSCMGPRSIMVGIAVLLMAAMPSAFAARALKSGQLDISAGGERKLLEVNFSGSEKVFKIREEDSEVWKCLDVEDEDATKVRGFKCIADIPDQRYRVKEIEEHNGMKYYQIKNELTHLCLAPEFNGHGADVQLVECDKEDAAQLWRRKREGDLSLIIPLGDDTLCLDFDDDEMKMFTCVGSVGQLFKLVDGN